MHLSIPAYFKEMYVYVSLFQIRYLNKAYIESLNSILMLELVEMAP